MILILMYISLLATTVAEEWSYHGHVDARHWYQEYERCNGNRQSPIDVEFEDLYEDPTLGPLEFSDSYCHAPLSNATFQHDHHTVRVSIPSNPTLELRAHGLSGSYQLHQFHFHWSHRDDTGSEHKVDNKFYPLELHLVHFHENLTEEEALFTNGSIVVIAVLFQWASHDDDRTYENKELNRLTDAMEAAKHPSVKTIIQESINMSRLLPPDIGSYLRYSGSLTTPPCSEVVEWILFTHVQNVSRHQMNQFRRFGYHNITLDMKHDQVMNETDNDDDDEDNDRPLEPLNERDIRVFGVLGDLFPFTSLNKSSPASYVHVLGEDDYRSAASICKCLSIFIMVVITVISCIFI